MTTAHKVRRVNSALGEYSLAAALEAVELAKSTLRLRSVQGWYYHQRRKVDYDEKYAHLLPALEKLARHHPEYGYRRTTAELHEVYLERVNHKVVQRLHQIWGLTLLRTTRAPRPSGIRQSLH